MTQRRHHGGAFKARVAIEAIAGHKTVNEIASAYEIHPSQVAKWKAEALMRRLDEQYTATPFYGVERMTAVLRREGLVVGHNRVRRLLRWMGLEALYPKPRLSVPGGPEHRVYPYLLRGVRIERPNQVWSADITYIRLAHGFAYLVAVLDWFSRYVVSWSLSVTLDAWFCVEALREALRLARPEIFNTDQGSQFTTAASGSGSCARRVWRSAWTAGAGRSTTSSRSVCGGL
jgi:putative transposase